MHPGSLLYSVNGSNQPAIQTSDNPYILTVNQPGTIQLESVVSVNGNCPGTVSGSVVIDEIDVQGSTSVTNAECGSSDGEVDLTASGGDPPYTFNLVKR